MTDWQDFVWDPARLSAWLSEGGTDSASSSRGCQDAGAVQPSPCQRQLQSGSTSEQQVPQHLRQLLLALLKAAADDGHGQELIWTPARLAQWLADSKDAPSRTCSAESTESGPASTEGSPSAIADPSQLRSYVQLLPLVCNVTASKALAQRATRSSSTSSDGSGTSCVTYPDLAAPCSSAMQMQAAGSDERTSPPYWELRHSRINWQPEPSLQLAHKASPCMGTQLPQHTQDGMAAVQQQQQHPLQHAQLQHQAPPAVPQLHSSQLWGVAKEAKPGDYPVVEHNTAWNPGAFTASAAAAASSLGLPAHGGSNPSLRPGGANNPTSSMQVGTDSPAQQQHKPGQAPRFGVLMLTHEVGVTAAEVWEAWEAQHGGRVVVRVHLKQGVSTAGLPGEAFISSRLLSSRIHTQWGCISLTSAILQAAADMLQQHPQLQHIAVASGQDVPVAGLPRDLRPGLSLFGRFQFGQAFDEAAQQVACDVLQAQLQMSHSEARAWADALVFHHTWMVLDRQLLLALLSKADEVRRVGAVLNERFMQPDVAVAADEFILITAAMRYGFVKQVVQKKLQAHMSAVRRQHKQQQAAALPVRRAAERAGSADGEQPAKQRRAESEAPDSSDSVMHTQAAARGVDGDSSGQDIAGADTRSSVDPAAATDSSSRPGSASRGSSRSTSDATWTPQPEAALLCVPGTAPPVSCQVQQSGSTTQQQQQQQGCQQVQDGPAAAAAAAAAGLSSSAGLQGSGTGSSSQPSRPSSGRRSRRADAASGAADVRPEELVGQRIRVWWQLDEAYYWGTVTYYSLSTKRHTVRYDDGDVEIINLAKESWKLQEPAHGTQGGTAAAAAAAGRGAGTQQDSSSSGSTASPMHEGTHGVLLDCCPTLVLFHPTDTRHPHEWRNFSECRLCDVNSDRQGNHKLTLLEALGMSQPNASLFFRKVAQMQRHGPAQLLACLKLLWKGKPLPNSVEELQLV